VGTARTLLPVREDRRGTGDVDPQAPVRFGRADVLFQSLLDGNRCIMPLAFIGLFPAAKVHEFRDDDEISVGHRTLDALGMRE